MYSFPVQAWPNSDNIRFFIDRVKAGLQFFNQFQNRSRTGSNFVVNEFGFIVLSQGCSGSIFGPIRIILGSKFIQYKYIYCYWNVIWVRLGKFGKHLDYG